MTGAKSVSEAWRPGQVKTGEFGLKIATAIACSYPNASSGAGQRMPRRPAVRPPVRPCARPQRHGQRIATATAGSTRSRATSLPAAPPPCSFSITVCADLGAQGHAQRHHVAAGNGGSLWTIASPSSPTRSAKPARARAYRERAARPSSIPQFNETELPRVSPVHPRRRRLLLGLQRPERGARTARRCRSPASVRIRPRHRRAPRAIRRSSPPGARRRLSKSRDRFGGHHHRGHVRTAKASISIRFRRR